MKTLQLSRDLVAIVDDVDFAKVSQFKWHAHKTLTGKFYAVRKVTLDGRRTAEYLHRHLLSPPNGYVVDHLNGDSLDNRRCNLRVATFAENLRNARTTIARGAFFDRRTGRWFTRISWNGRRLMLGRYQSEQQAHAVASKARALLEAGVAFEDVKRLSVP